MSAALRVHRPRNAVRILADSAQLGVSISDAKGMGLPAALLALAHRAMLHALVAA